MRIKELMTVDAEVLTPESTIGEAAQAMADADVGGLPVLRRGKVVGILTDRDIVVRVVAEGLEPDATTVEQVMTSDVLHCSEEDDVEQAASLMARNQVRRLVVLDDAEEFAGIVTLADLALGDAETAGIVLEAVSSPSEELTQGVYAGGPARVDHDGGESSAAALVHDELAAVETYKQVLQTVHGGKAGDALRRIENEHEEAARILKDRLHRLGLGVRSGSIGGSAWSGAWEKSAEFLDEKTSIRLLKEGEEREIEDYERALGDGGLDSGLKKLIASSLLPRTRAHVPALARMLAEVP
jgi:CBS domain-containing protein